MIETSGLHTFRRYDGELTSLHQIVLEMGEAALSQLAGALSAFREGDLEAARNVISKDAELDRLEVSGDAEIIRVISRNAPQACDLRRIITVSKSVSDLEKIGDEAVRIASILLEIERADAGSIGIDLIAEVSRVGDMALDHLRTALGLFEVWDLSQAYSVCEGHRQMDGVFRQELHRVMTEIFENRFDVSLAVSFVLVTKSLDRVAHHASNLAEYAIFEMSGDDVRLTQP